MKKTTLGIVCTAAGILVGAACLLLVLRIFPGADVLLGRGEMIKLLSTADAQTGELVEAALDIAGYIKDNDFKALSEVVHPEYGVYFSPSATVSLASNKCFKASEVASFGENKISYVWGIKDDTGAPIEMTPAAYFSFYVFDNDYTSPSMIGVDYIVKSGNALDNVSDVFPGAQFVDLLDPGTKETDYADWSVLRLVFEEYDGIYMLTAIIHSEASI